MCQVTKLSVYYSIFSIFVLQLKLWLFRCYFGANFAVRSASKTVRLRCLYPVVVQMRHPTLKN